jgi:hypothetical protein
MKQARKLENTLRVLRASVVKRHASSAREIHAENAENAENAEEPPARFSAVRLALRITMRPGPNSH